MQVEIKGGYLVIRLPVRIAVENVAFGQALDLTKREEQVLEGILRGEQDKEIAPALNLSVSAIKFHVRSILRKTKCHTRWEIARRYAGANCSIQHGRPKEPMPDAKPRRRE